MEALASQIERVDGCSQGTDGMLGHLNSYLGERLLRGSIFLLGNVFLFKKFYMLGSSI